MAVKLYSKEKSFLMNGKKEMLIQRTVSWGIISGDSPDHDNTIVENDDEAKSLYDPDKWKIGWYKLHSSYDKNTEPSVTTYERRGLCVHP